MQLLLEFDATAIIAGLGQPGELYVAQHDALGGGSFVCDDARVVVDATMSVPSAAAAAPCQCPPESSEP